MDALPPLCRPHHPPACACAGTAQRYEWLQYTSDTVAEALCDERERWVWLRATWALAFAAMADRYRGKLVATYGAKRGQPVLHAEVFAIGEYGAPLTSERKVERWGTNRRPC